jgi:thiol-disulfide isomerase/thioredoxin
LPFYPPHSHPAYLLPPASPLSNILSLIIASVDKMKRVTAVLLSHLLLCARVGGFVLVKSSSQRLRSETKTLGTALDDENFINTESSRASFIRQMLGISGAAVFAKSFPAYAAPPFAIMAEEVGYFPVTDERTGETVMVPAKAKRSSTDQSVELAKYLQSSGAKMYGAFWCPHCQRQKELFGREAWKYVDYVECSPNGYRAKYATCIDQKVDGYPTWKFGNGKTQGGEMELAEIARVSGFLKKRAFDASLETGVPALGGGSCQ